jgi:hypothetical protein
VDDPALPADARENLKSAARRARPHLHTLLDLRVELRCVVLLGRYAQEAWVTP